MSMKAILASFKKGTVLIPVLRDYVATMNQKIEDGQRSKKDDVILDAKLTIQSFRDRIKEFNHGEEIEGEYFHPSSLGSCLRKTWFKAMKAPESKQSKMDLLRSYMIFDVGHYIHVIIMNLIERAKIPAEREIAIKDKVNKILGHCDVRIELDGTKYIVEIKTINFRWWTKVAKQPLFEHKVQIHCYMKALDVKWGIILYFNKDSCELKEYVVQYDPDFYEKYCRSRILKFFKCVKELIIPEREEGDLCAFCPFAETVCFKDKERNEWLKQLRRSKNNATHKEILQLVSKPKYPKCKNLS